VKVPALFLGLGLAAGYLVAGSASPTAPAPARVAAPAVTRAEVRAELHHELARARVAVAPVVIERLEPADSADDTDAPEDLAERADLARLVVERATARGVWTDADRDALRTQFEGLPGETQAEIFAAMSDAVNRGVLRVTADTPL